MNKHFLTAAAAATLIAVALPAAAQNLAIVNGKPIPSSRVDALAQQMSRAGRPVTDEMKGQIKEEVIAREIFMQEAQKQGLDATDDYRHQVELAKQTILIRELFAKYQKQHPISDAEIKAEYDRVIGEAKAQAGSGKEYRASHILVESEAEAKQIIADLKKGAKFDELAKKHSKDPGSGARGGDLDWANPDNYVKPFSEAMVKLNKGQMTDAPVKSDFGYHIIKLEDVRTAKAPEFPPLDQVKPQIAQQLQQQKMQAYQEALRAKAKVQ